MDSATKWLVRGACGVVILSGAASVVVGSYAVLRGRYEAHQAAVALAERTNCGWIQRTPEFRLAREECLQRVINRQGHWFATPSPVEKFLFGIR